MRFIWEISNNRPILLLVDEIGRAKHKILVPKLHSLRESYHDKFFVFYSALNPEYLGIDGTTISTRAIFFVPLYRRTFKSVKSHFDQFIQEKGQQLDDNDSRLLERCVSFCNGHMRTLEALYVYLKNLAQLKNLEFPKIADGTFYGLKTLQGGLPTVTAEDAKICISGKEVRSDDYTKTNPKITYRQAVAMSCFFNQEDDLNEKVFVPKLTPFALYWVRCFSGIFFANFSFLIHLRLVSKQKQ